MSRILIGIILLIAAPFVMRVFYGMLAIIGMLIRSIFNIK